MRRRSMNFNDPITVKLHPDHKAWLDIEADKRYCSVGEVIRQLITEAMRKDLVDEERYERRTLS